MSARSLAEEPRSRRAPALMSNGWSKLSVCTRTRLAPGRLLVEGEAVDHPRRVAPVVEEMEPLEAEGLHDRGVAQRAQEPRHRFLRGLHERAAGGEIEPIEIVERGDAEQAREPGAHEVGALALGVVDRGQAPGPELEALREGGIAQRAVDDALLTHDAQIAVGEVLERLPVLDEVVRGPSRRQDEGEDPLVGLGSRARRRALVGERAIHRGEIGAEPGAQAVVQAVDLAVVGRGGEGHRVEIVDDDEATSGERLRAALVRAQARRQHLAKLLPRRGRAPVRRVPELLDLGGQRARPDHPRVIAEPRAGVHDDGAREPPPVDRRIQVGPALVEELPVLDEEQGRYHGGRDPLEALVDPVGIAARVDDAPGAVDDAEAGLRLLAVDGKEAAGHDLLQPR